MELTEQEKAVADAKSQARREMLAIVAAGKADAVKKLEAAHRKAQEMQARRDRSTKAADAKIAAFRRDEVKPAQRAARECDEAIQALWAEFVPVKLVRARDAADAALGHAQARFRKHELDELETKRLLKLATARGRIDSTKAREWKEKIKASAKDRKALAAELEELTKAAHEAETALADARAAALEPAAAAE